MKMLQSIARIAEKDHMRFRFGSPILAVFQNGTRSPPALAQLHENWLFEIGTPSALMSA
jgi:hypothetical protein